MLKQMILAVSMVALLAGGVSARRAKKSKGGSLPTFQADLGMKTKKMGPKTVEVRIPYTDMTSYFGYVKPGQEPDATIDGKKMFFLYIWVPAVVPEIGVRMASPATMFAAPAEGDIVDASYKADDKDNYFDTWINFERALTVVGLESMKATKDATPWLSLGKNDDSSEMPKNGGGQRYNSLLRITSDIKDVKRSLVRGLYRVAFTTYKKGEVKGSFVAQVGAPIKIPGVIVSRSIDDIITQLEAKKAAK